MPTTSMAHAAPSIVRVLPIRDLSLVRVQVRSVRERQAALLRDQLREIAAEARGRIVLSMLAVSDATASCLCALVACGRQCRGLGGGLMVVGLPLRLHPIVLDGGFTADFQLCSDEHEGIRRLSGEPVAAQPGGGGGWRLFSANLSRWLSRRAA